MLKLRHRELLGKTCGGGPGHRWCRIESIAAPFGSHDPLGRCSALLPVRGPGVLRWRGEGNTPSNATRSAKDRVASVAPARFGVITGADRPQAPTPRNVESAR